MLVLARREGQTIRIGDDIVIHLPKATGRTLIGVEAPRSIKVVRGELLNQNVAQVQLEETTK